MKCPYCGSEMKEGDDSSTTWERFRGKGELQCVYYSRIPGGLISVPFTARDAG